MKWEKVKLGDIATCIQPGPFGSQLHNSDYTKEGTPFIKPIDIVGGAIVHSVFLKVSEEHVKRLSRHQVYEGNLMVARKGDVRKCAYITANENGWMTGSDCLKVVLDESKCYPKFIYYQLRSEHIGRWLEKVSIGATMPSLNTGLLSGIEMVLPPIEIQKQIAGILSVYDDLIENNRKQIKLLEEAARRLYKEWFVDLRFPGHENTKIVDGVPEGWSRTNINEILTFHRGYDLTKNEMKAGRYPVVGSTTVIGYHNEFKIKGPGIVTGRSGSLGKYQFIWDNFWPHNTSLYISDYKDHNIFFVYSLHQTVDIASLNNGGAIPTLNRNVLSNIEVIEPTDELQEMFAKIAEAQYRKIRNLEKQNNHL